MAIVLAIEPDKRQAAHLTAILMQVDAELVIADTTEGALDAIGNRVPDLVLVPALLSPQDDAALAAALRVIAAAAHVRTLTIPVLASSVKRAASRGMLSKWRKNRVASPEPDGCDPAVFGEQISTYLSEAAAERALIEEDARLEDEPTPAAPPAFEPSRIHASLSAAVESPVEHAVWAVAPLLQEATAAVASLVDQRDMPSLHTEAEVDAAMWREPGEPRLVEEEHVEEEHVEEEHVEQSAVWAAPTHQQTAMEVAEAPAIEHNEEIVIQEGEAPLIDLSMELATLSEDTESGAADIEPVAIYTISVEGDEPWDAPFVVAPAKLNPLTDADAAALDLALSSGAVELVREPLEPQLAERLFVESLFADIPPAGLVDAPLLPEPVDARRAGIQPRMTMSLTPGRIWPALEGMPAETAVAPTEQPDWIELVASLRQDLERRLAEPASADPIATRPSDGPIANAARPARKPRPAPRTARPVQDEWGFFDPERCGFSTLLAKLEEITEEEVRT